MSSEPRRLRIAIVGPTSTPRPTPTPSPCGQCRAACCVRSVSEYAILLQTDDERRRFAPWSLSLAVRDAEEVVRHERVIPYRHDTGRCPFLGEDNRCTIYEDRPQSCRDFECTRHFNQHGPGRHGMFLEGNRDVANLMDV